MALDVKELVKQKQAYEAQRIQHQEMFHQLTGAISILNEQIKKLDLLQAQSDKPEQEEANAAKKGKK